MYNFVVFVFEDAPFYLILHPRTSDFLHFCLAPVTHWVAEFVP